MWQGPIYNGDELFYSGYNSRREDVSPTLCDMFALERQLTEQEKYK